MRLIYKLIFTIFIASLTSCASTKIAHEFNNDSIKNKRIYFTLSDKSDDVKIKEEGPNIGKLILPNVRDAFRNSVEELSKETQLDTRFSYSYNQTDSSIIHIEATITETIWKFTLSSATMISYVNYKIDGIDKTYQTIGLFNNMWGGSEKNHLTKSLKNANFKLLRELDKTENEKQTIY